MVKQEEKAGYEQQYHNRRRHDPWIETSRGSWQSNRRVSPVAAGMSVSFMWLLNRL